MKRILSLFLLLLATAAAAQPSIFSKSPSNYDPTNVAITGGTIGVDAGSAGSPSIYFAADADGTGTGFFRAVANQIGVAINGSERFRVGGGAVTTPDPIGLGTSTAAIDNWLVRAGANNLRWGQSTGTATARTEINKAIASIPDNTATATITVTVPNAAHAASLKVTLIGTLGAGGAIGAGEATGTISYDIAIARTAGVATVATLSSGYGSATSAVSGAATITVTGAVSSLTGANDATQTFTVNITIARGSGSSTNHTALVYGRLMNANASGITLS